MVPCKSTAEEFHLNDHIIGFCPQTQKLELHYMSPLLTLGGKVTFTTFASVLHKKICTRTTFMSNTTKYTSKFGEAKNMRDVLRKINGHHGKLNFFFISKFPNKVLFFFIPGFH